MAVTKHKRANSQVDAPTDDVQPNTLTDDLSEDSLSDAPVGSEEANTSGKGDRKRRGRNLGRSLDEEGGVVEIGTNVLGQPVCPKTRALVNHIGGIASSGITIPLDIKTWKMVETRDIDAALSPIYSRFKVEHPNGKDWLKAKLNERWKAAKNNLKSKYFKKSKDINVQYANRPAHIDKSQWEHLVQYWRSDEGRKKRKIGKKNRSKLKLKHRLGTKSIAETVHEMTNKKNGVVPSQMEVFMTVFSTNDGPLDTGAQEVVEAVADHLNERAEGTLEIITLDQALEKVIGGPRHGRIPLVGMVPPDTIARRQRDSLVESAMAAAERAQRDADEARKRTEELEMLHTQEIARVEEKHELEMQQLVKKMAVMEEYQRAQDARHAEMIRSVTAFGTPYLFSNTRVEGLNQSQYPYPYRPELFPQPQHQTQSQAIDPPPHMREAE